MIVEIIEAATYGEVEQSKAVGAHQVKVRAKPVSILLVRQLAVLKPFQVQGEDATFGEIDANLLLVLDRFSRRAHVPVHV